MTAITFPRDAGHTGVKKAVASRQQGINSLLLHRRLCDAPTRDWPQLRHSWDQKMSSALHAWCGEKV